MDEKISVTVQALRTRARMLHLILTLSTLMCVFIKNIMHW